MLERAQRQQQVQGATTRSLLNTTGGTGTSIEGTPETKQFKYDRSAGGFYPELAGPPKTIGQNAAATPLVSQASVNRNFQRARPELAPEGSFNAAALQSMISQAFPAPIAPKDRYLGQPGEGGVLDIVTREIVPGSRMTPKPPADVQSALFQADGNAEEARKILNANGLKGEWAINSATGRMEFLSPQTLLASPGKYMKPPSGMKITSDGQGGFEMLTGDMAGGGGGMTKSTETGLEQTIIQGRDSLALINGLSSEFKPEYQQLGTRWNSMYSNAKDKLGLPLDEATKSQLSQYSSYQQKGAELLNKTIRDLTGATVGVQEAPRLLLQVPVAGQGLLDGDGPTRFQAKMKSVTDSITASIARAEYARANGLTKKQQFAIPLDTVPQMINAKGDQYRSDILRAQPNIPPEQLTEMVKNRLRQEFGLQ